MSKQLTPIAAALGAAFVLSLATSPVAADAVNPFGLSDLSSGYATAMGDNPEEAKAGEAKCGTDKMKDAKCGADKKKHEAKCGAGKMKDAKCGSDKMKHDAKKAGEGKCGGDKMKHDAKKAAEGKCGGKAKEAKCGEGKCGGKK